MRYMTSAKGWTAELTAMFVSGFLLATLIWLGLWFFHSRPSYAATLEAKEAEWHNCVAASTGCRELKDKLQNENDQLSKQLEQARLGWGRCLRGKGTTEE